MSKTTREIVDAGNRRAEVVALLRHYLSRAQADDADFTGLMLILEQPGGAYVTAQSGTSNVAERLGRLELLKADVLDLADDQDEAAPSVRLIGKRGKTKP